MAKSTRQLDRKADPAIGFTLGFSRAGLGTERPGSIGGTLHFLRHFGEMLLAMVAGMMVLGAVDRGILAAAGASASSFQDTAPELVSLVMAFNMTAGMTVWMRHRRHPWPRVAEMAGAMFVPALAAIVLFW